MPRRRKAECGILIGTCTVIAQGAIGLTWLCRILWSLSVHRRALKLPFYRCARACLRYLCVGRILCRECDSGKMRS